MLKSARNAPDGAFRIRCIMLILGKLKGVYKIGGYSHREIRKFLVSL